MKTRLWRVTGTIWHDVTTAITVDEQVHGGDRGDALIAATMEAAHRAGVKWTSCEWGKLKAIDITEVERLKAWNAGEPISGNEVHVLDDKASQ